MREVRSPKNGDDQGPGCRRGRMRQARSSNLKLLARSCDARLRHEAQTRTRENAAARISSKRRQRSVDPSIGATKKMKTSRPQGIAVIPVGGEIHGARSRRRDLAEGAGRSQLGDGVGQLPPKPAEPRGSVPVSRSPARAAGNMFFLVFMGVFIFLTFWWNPYVRGQ